MSTFDPTVDCILNLPVDVDQSSASVCGKSAAVESRSLVYIVAGLVSKLLSGNRNLVVMKVVSVVGVLAGVIVLFGGGSRAAKGPAVCR